MPSAPKSSTPAKAVPPATSLTRLRHEHTRQWVATAISLPAAIAGSVVLHLYVAGDLVFLPEVMLSWVLWSITYSVLTVRTFGRATADQLPALVSAGPDRLWKRVIVGGAQAGPGLAVQLAALALAAAALLPRIEAYAPEPGDGVILTVLIVATVITSWVVVTLSYALHYARSHLAGDGLDFPGGDSPTFRDFLYFSTSIATTFGTTDVSVTSTRLRGIVTTHSVLTFIFNTVIIALTVSAFTR